MSTIAVVACTLVGISFYQPLCGMVLQRVEWLGGGRLGHFGPVGTFSDFHIIAHVKKVHVFRKFQIFIIFQTFRFLEFQNFFYIDISELF